MHEGERSLVANLSAANTFTPAHLELEESKAIIDRAQVYYMAGFFLTVSVESFLAIGQHAVANYKTVCVSLCLCLCLCLGHHADLCNAASRA